MKNIYKFASNISPKLNNTLLEYIEKDSLLEFQECVNKNNIALDLSMGCFCALEAGAKNVLDYLVSTHKIVFDVRSDDESYVMKYSVANQVFAQECYFGAAIDHVIAYCSDEMLDYAINKYLLDVEVLLEYDDDWCWTKKLFKLFGEKKDREGRLDHLVTKYGLDLTTLNEQGQSLLFDAIAYYAKSDIHDYFFLDTLVTKYHLNPHICDKKGRTLLHKAARYNRPTIIDFLVTKYQLCLYTPDNKGQSLLQIAVRKSNIDMVDHLVSKHNQDPRMLDKAGHSSLHYALKTHENNNDMFNHLVTEHKLPRSMDLFEYFNSIENTNTSLRLQTLLVQYVWVKVDIEKIKNAARRKESGNNLVVLLELLAKLQAVDEFILNISPLWSFQRRYYNVEQLWWNYCLPHLRRALMNICFSPWDILLALSDQNVRGRLQEKIIQTSIEKIGDHPYMVKSLREALSRKNKNDIISLQTHFTLFGGHGRRMDKNDHGENVSFLGKRKRGNEETIQETSQERADRFERLFENKKALPSTKSMKS